MPDRQSYPTLGVYSKNHFRTKICLSHLNLFCIGGLYQKDFFIGIKIPIFGQAVKKIVSNKGLLDFGTLKTVRDTDKMKYIKMVLF